MHRPGDKGRAIRLLAIGLIIGLGAYWAGSRWGQRVPSVVNALRSSSTPSEAGLDPTETENVRIYKQAAPAVANIVTRTVEYDFFFNPVPVEGAGSGFLMDNDGHILTNFHVVQGAQTIEVTLGDQSRYKGKLVGSDPNNDIALIQIDLAGRKIAIPGTLTTSYLALKLFEPNVETVTMPFDKILDAVRTKEVEAGLLIHEGQLLFSEIGLHRVVDLGQWWQEETSLPLPLGANATRRSLGPDMGRQVARIIRESVSYALEHREAALEYALQFARDMEPRLAEKFVGMYVNHYTVDAGEVIPKAAQKLLDMG